MDHGLAALGLITFFAAIVNGGLGYGFSSLTVPVALLFYTNRVLNPVLVVVEVFINLYVLVINRASVPAVWPRIYPILIGLLPGVVLGSWVLSSVHPGWLKFVVYVLLLPMIFLQIIGLRRPIQSEKLFGLPFGAGLGFLYSVTTISGPPLAVMFNNQGLVKQEFRAALGVIRLAESSLTAIAYYHLGLFVAQALPLFYLTAASVLVGIPLGAWLIKRVDADTFRRLCMSFDAWIVAFGLSRVLLELKLATTVLAYWPVAACVACDLALLAHFFSRRRKGLT